ncbi:MAG: pyridoxal phosphate-dependent aminotransferase [Paludibacteraceae bacterium]|nr:pyridoxal phosphate-dependent aminotransferase [Paludibacteraceae bacterium]
MFPLNKQTVDHICIDFGLRNAHELGAASIRQLVGVVKDIERATGQEFIHMELGEPGLPSEAVGIEAEHQALLAGYGAKYPVITGIPELKHWGSEFVKAFVGLDIPDECIVPTVGSMQAAFALNMTMAQLDSQRDTVLFIDPCFPVQKQQCKVIGVRVDCFDVADFRGEKLAEELERHFQTGRIAAMLFSNPNNPSWMCLTERELEIIGRLATKYNVLVIEDLAYLNMDFRDKKRGTPYEPPYQPSVGRYTNDCVHMISSSKMFSYAGQRGAIVAINPALAHRCFPSLGKRYGNDGQFLRNFVYIILYSLSSGVTHSVQFAMAAMFRAACQGKLNFVDHTREYERRAARIKEIMVRNGFHIVYDKDADGSDVGNGFFFTFGYKDWTGEQMLNKLIYYGVSAIALAPTGAQREGMRGCASAIREDQYEELDKRLKKFNEDFSNQHP